MLSSESESLLLVLHGEGEEVGLDMADSLVVGDASSGGICVSSCGIARRVLFIATRCASNWSMLGSFGKNGPEKGLEWV